MKRASFFDVSVGQEFVMGGDLWRKTPLTVRANQRGNTNAYAIHDETRDMLVDDEVIVWALDPYEPRENVVDACLLSVVGRQAKRRGIEIQPWLNIPFHEWNIRKIQAMRRWNQS